MTQKPILHGGCGRIILPAPRPAHHGLVDEALYSYPLFVNADRNYTEGVDEVIDLFSFPWHWADNSFDGALFAHLVEHLPHEIKINPVAPVGWDEVDWNHRAYELAQCQDAWWAFFSEVHRVCTAGSIVHILSPYGWSQGALTDPSHCRYLTEHTFDHSMKPDPNSPFAYKVGGIHFEQAGVQFGVTQLFQHLVPNEHDTPDTARDKMARFQYELQTRINVCYDVYCRLRVVK